MDINQLKCFISVARTLNFSEAARRNYVSQSTVSRYIIDLEKEFGVQLFIRSHRDVLLTNEGKTLLPYAIEIVETLNKATSIIKQMHVIADKTNTAAKQKNISMADLANEKLVLLSENVSPILYMEVMDLYRTFHISPKITNTFDDVKSMYMAVAAGMGISIVLAWSKSATNPVAKHFLELVKEYANDVDNIYGL